MSNRKLLTAEQLGITQAEYEALLSVRDDLANGRLCHISLKKLEALMESADYDWYESDATMFNMHEWSCGTAACIGGWMELKLGNRGYFASDHRQSEKSLNDLFYKFPGFNSQDKDPTPEEAVRAIDRYLTNGPKNPWQL